MFFKKITVVFVVTLYLTAIFQCYKIGFEEATKRKLKITRSFLQHNGTQTIDNKTQGPILDSNSMSLCKRCFWPGQTDFTIHTQSFSKKIKQSHGLVKLKDSWVNVHPYAFQTHVEYDTYYDWKGSKVLTQMMTCPIQRTCYIALLYHQNLTHEVAFKSFNSTSIPEKIGNNAWQLKFDKQGNPVVVHIFRGPSRRALWWNPVDYVSLEMKYYNTWIHDKKLTNVIPSILQWPIPVPLKNSTQVPLPSGIWGYEIAS